MKKTVVIAVLVMSVVGSSFAIPIGNKPRPHIPIGNKPRPTIPIGNVGHGHHHNR